MRYTYYIPNKDGEKEEKCLENINSVLIVGANGSGKSRLGAWMEQQEPSKIHRISGQRKINFDANFQRFPYTSAEQCFLYGDDRETESGKKFQHKFGYREDDPVIKQLDDYSKVLSFLLAKEHEELRNFQIKYKNSTNKLDLKPDNIIDTLKKIWKTVFQHKQIDVKKDLFTCYSLETSYPATQMSDGERSILYLIAQVLCVPKNYTIIIDEPELHLHPSLMYRLWSTLEQHRKDCLFIYITHDLKFASEHIISQKIWIESFDGKKWSFKFLEQNQKLPDEIFLNILGSRKNILFVEGQNSSLDFKLYNILYPDYQVIPCGNCEKVIEFTKAFNEQNALHHFQAFGIIDKDYRSNEETLNLKNDNIFVLGLAEIENLFLLENVIKSTLRYMNKDEKLFDEIKEHILKTKFQNKINQQINQSVVKEIKYKLNTIDISQIDDEEEIKNNIISILDYNNLKSKYQKKFEQIISDENYDDLLKVFNEKDICDRFLLEKCGIKDKKTYYDITCEIIKSQDEIRNEILKYIPKID